MKMTGTPRSGTEQLLLTNSWDKVLCQVDYGPLRGSRVFLDTSHVEATDKGWVIATLKRSMLRQGVILNDAKADADLILVAAVAAYGTDDRVFQIGPAQETFELSGSESSPSLSRVNNQSSVVKLAMFAYDAKTSCLIWESEPLCASDFVQDRFFLGVGPNRLSSVPDLNVYGATRTNLKSSTHPCCPPPCLVPTWTSPHPCSLCEPSPIHTPSPEDGDNNSAGISSVEAGP